MPEKVRLGDPSGRLCLVTADVAALREGERREPVFACPVCSRPLVRGDRAYACSLGHAFDIAREGYVNLLLSTQKRSRDPGYGRAMVQRRSAFLDAGHYERLADEIADRIADTLDEPISGGSSRQVPVVLDAGCGEGYYLRRLRHVLQRRPPARSDVVLVGLDISKHAIRAAARRDPAGEYAVAGTYHMPVMPGSISVLLTQFSPVSPEDFSRVVKPGGVVLVGGPGRDHLFELKQHLYDEPQRHDEDDALAGVPGFEGLGQYRFRYDLVLGDAEQVQNLVGMTPFGWVPGQQARTLPDRLRTQVDVVVRGYRRVEDDPMPGSGGSGPR